MTATIASRPVRLIFTLFLLPLALMACTGLQKRSPESVSFLAFGDSGYHYDYIKKSVLERPMTPTEYLADEHANWRKKHLPESEFKAVPMYIVPGTQQAIEASGAQPVADAMYRYCVSNNCQFALMLGDNIYPKGATGNYDEVRFKKIFEQPYRQLVNSRAGFKLYAALGNHDWKTSRLGRERQIEYGERASTAFTLKSPGYYRFTKGDVEFFVIDTNLLLADTVVRDHTLNPDGSEKPSEELDTPKAWELPNEEDQKQLRWLKQALQQSTAKWKVVYGHHTLWSAGGSKFEQARALRKLIGHMLCRYADIYISGHEHEQEVNLDTCEKETGTSDYPLPLVVSGAGAWQRPVHHPFQRFQEASYPQYKVLWSRGMSWGFSHIEIAADQMTVRMFTTPDDGFGRPLLETTLIFGNRSRELKEQGRRW